MFTFTSQEEYLADFLGSVKNCRLAEKLDWESDLVTYDSFFPWFSGMHEKVSCHSQKKGKWFEKCFTYTHSFYHFSGWQPYVSSICQYEVWTKTLVSLVTIVLLWICVLYHLPCFLNDFVFQGTVILQKEIFIWNVQKLLLTGQQGRCWPHISACLPLYF